MQCHVVVLGTTGTTYAFYERDKTRNKKKVVVPLSQEMWQTKSNELNPFRTAIPFGDKLLRI